jgi:Tol biopolymer transport system component
VEKNRLRSSPLHEAAKRCASFYRNPKIEERMIKFKILVIIFFFSLLSCTSIKRAHMPFSYSSEVVDKPIIFAEGIISIKDRNVFDISFTSNGKTAYFTLRKGNEKQKIYFSNFVNHKWTEPQIASFSNDRDECPSLTPDGKTIYFGSQRPISGRTSKGNFDMNIWQTNWTNGKWSEPTPLSETINKVQIEKEEWPSSTENSIFTYDGVNHYFATMVRDSKMIEMYQTKLENKKFIQPEKIIGLFEDDKYWKSTPVISPDGKYMVFNSYGNPAGKGGEDIYISKKIANGWTKAKNIGNLINTKAEEAAARFSNDGKYFFFAREIKQNPDQDGIWSIYYVETKFLHIDQLFKN